MLLWLWHKASAAVPIWTPSPENFYMMLKKKQTKKKNGCISMRILFITDAGVPGLRHIVLERKAKISARANYICWGFPRLSSLCAHLFSCKHHKPLSWQDRQAISILQIGSQGLERLSLPRSQR